MAETAASLGIVAATTAFIYVFLILLLRVFGQRELAQLSVIDLIVVLMLGSAVETAMIHGDLTLPAGLVSATTLFVVNKALSLAFLRSDRLRHLVGGGPVLLVHDGRPVAEHLRRVGMTASDVAEAVRARGYDDLGQVRFAVLETNGEVSVVPQAS